MRNGEPAHKLRIRRPSGLRTGRVVWRWQRPAAAASHAHVRPDFEIAEAGGEYGKGLVRAVLELKPDHWFFPCHFKGDPVMPGCLGLDALWQLLGFFLGWLGAPGKGRALGLGELKFSGQVLPNIKQVIYGVEIKRVMRSKLVLGVADGWLSADGQVIYRASDLKVGLFKQDEPGAGG